MIPENTVIPEKPAIFCVGDQKAGDSNTTTTSINHDCKADCDARKRTQKERVRCHQIQQFNVTY